MAVNVEFRGGPRNAEIEQYANDAAIPHEIEMAYVDANMQGSKPLERVGHYRYDGAYRFAWHVDHARGAGRPIDVETPESDLDVTDHTRPREARPTRGR